MDAAFIRACHCDLTRVRSMLKESPGLISARGHDNETPLGAAAHSARPDIVRCLLDQGADPEFGAAIVLGETEQIRSLLTHEPGLAQARVTSAHNFPPLYFAAISGQTDAATLLLEHGAKLDATDDRGLTPLHGAAAHDQVPMIRWLLDHGATRDAFSPFGGTPLHMAVWEGHEQAVRFLLRAGAVIAKTTRDGQTPQEIAVERGHVALADFLATFLKTDNAPAWMHAIALGADAAREYFYQHPGALHTARHHGHSPLGWAAHLGDRDTVSTLLEMGAELTPEAAIIMGCKDYVRGWLADNPWRVNVRRVEGRNFPLLYFAAIRGDLEMAELLLEHGADINGDHTFGATVLYGAAEFGQLAMVRFLLEQEADVNAASKWGLTPLHRAAHGGYRSVAQILVDHGADPSARSRDGESVLDAARLNGHTAFADWLTQLLSQSEPMA